MTTEKIHAVDGTLAFEVGPNGDRPGVRVKTHLPEGGSLSVPLDDDAAQAMALAILAIAPDDEGGEAFCPRCAAGIDSPEHHEKCVALGWAINSEPAPEGAPHYWTAPEARP